MRSQVLIDAFDLKIRASLAQLEKEVAQLEASTFNIGHITLACALSYMDFRFDSLGWRKLAPALGAWYDRVRERPSIKVTEPQLEG
jgi:glutathione S-transferase